MKRLAGLGLCLALVLTALAATPVPAVADGWDCCADAQQSVEWHCSAIGAQVAYFQCIEGYMGSLCAVWYSCTPPPI